MSLQNEDPRLPDQPTPPTDEMPKKLKISYTREFLLSFSDLDVYKKLPIGFDQSMISEFEDAFRDLQRTSSGLSSLNFRRNEYGSSPPTRGDVAGYSRAIPGRWENRSTGRSDKDSDSQSDRDSDSGRHFGNQPRRTWQVPEHDGLLGSGSFPRPAGFTAGISGPKVRPNDSYQLNRTNEPYHPPRPYKAAPYSRRESDSLNDETFGSSELTNEDRAEEERKRRASFELMRKEQHKEFQEKQKLKPEKNKADFDFATLLDDPKDEKRLLHRSSKIEEPLMPPSSNNDSEKSTFPLQVPASRPLVPPGFASTVLDRNLGAKSLGHSLEVEVGLSERQDSTLHAKSKFVLNGMSDNQVEKQSAEQVILGKQQHGRAGTHASVDGMSGMSEKNLNLSPPLGALNKIIGIGNQLFNIADTPQALEASRNTEVVELNAEKVTGSKIVGESNQGDSTSILEKLFSSAVALNGVESSNISKHNDSKADETWVPDTFQSSKFAHWFHEGKKPGDDLSTGKRSDLLSLIVGSENGGSHISDGRIRDYSFPSFSSQNSEPADRLIASDIVSPAVGNSEQSSRNNNPEVVSAVLTCEDLEQSILSGISENDPTLQPPVQKWAVPDGKPEPEPLKANVDNHASQHLLSLLQMGTGLKDMEPFLNQETSSKKLHGMRGIGPRVQNSKEDISENSSDSGKSLTLETLFGTAFMKELQSVGAPVSVKRGPIGSVKGDVLDPHGLPLPMIDNSLLPSAVEIGPTRHSSGDLTAHRREPAKSDNNEERWLDFDNPRIEQGSSQVGTDLGSKIGVFGGSADFRLPEEDSLFTVSEPLNMQNFTSSGNLVKSKLFSPNTQGDIAGKLAAMNSGFKDERSNLGSQEGLPFLHGPYEMREPDIAYQNLNVQPSSQQLHHPQLNHVGRLFNPLDSHPVRINSQMNFMAPDGVIRSDPPPNHQFHPNMLRPPFRHANSGQSGFDAHTNHPMLQQMPGSFPPHMLQGLSSSPPPPPHVNQGGPVPAHPNSQGASFMPDLNPMAGFPLGPRQPNFGGRGLPSPGPDVAGGSNHPEALQRLIEMELRSKTKQIHPFAAGGHAQGMHGHELDMGFGYREFT